MKASECSFPNMAMEGPENQAIPDKLLGQIIHNLQLFPNETVDFSRPQMRKSLEHVYPVFVVLYGTLVVLGTIANVAMITHILRRRLYRDPTCAFVMNIGVCNVIMSVLLLPLSLAILLVQNWIFGSFLCYFVPMLQDVPLHASTATLVVAAIDRYRMVVLPLRPRLPPFIAVLAVWVTSVCVVLPYAVYMNYIDLQVLFGRQFEGVGICTVNLGDDIAEYTRGLFVVLYAFPLALITFLHIRVSGEMKSREVPDTVAMQQRSRASQPDVWSVHEASGGGVPRNGLDREGDWTIERYSYDHTILAPATPSNTPTHAILPPPTPTPPPLFDGREEYYELDLAREKRNQRYFGAIVAAFAVCLCPLMILRLVKNMVNETYENSGHFDITFITFVWLAFLPTVTTPVLFAMWKINRYESLRRASFVVPPSPPCWLAAESSLVSV